MAQRNIISELAKLDIEQAVLGALLIDPDAIWRVQDILEPRHFAWESHQKLYTAIMTVVKREHNPDLVLLCDELDRHGELAQIGHADLRGTAYLSSLPGHCTNSVMAEQYAEQVRDYAIKREIVQAAGRIAALATKGESANEVLTQALGQLENINCNSKDDLAPTAELIDEFIPVLTDWLEGQREVWGLPTGLKDLDDLTGGFEPGELVLVAARPGMGKSALLAQIARHIGEQGHGSAFFSMEMTRAAMTLRLLCAGARVDSQRIKRGIVNDGEQQRIWDDMAKVHDLPIWWRCGHAVSVPEITANVAKLRARQDVSLIAVDYIGLMKGYGETENIRVGNISKALKNLALRFNVCVLAAVQLNREIERRGDGKPKLSDLRDSGSLEQDADKILFINRQKDGTVDVVLAKNRNGKARVGMRNLVFLEEYAVFADKAKEGSWN